MFDEFRKRIADVIAPSRTIADRVLEAIPPIVAAWATLRAEQANSNGAQTKTEIAHLSRVVQEVKRRMSVAETASGEPVNFDAGGDPEGYCGPKTPKVRGVPSAAPANPLGRASNISLASELYVRLENANSGPAAALRVAIAEFCAIQ